MPAASARLAALVLVACAVFPAFARALDPQSAIEQAEAALASGDVEQARRALAAARALLAEPRWDPDGSIAGRLLPDLEARTAQLRSAVARLGQAPGSWARERAAAPPLNEPADAAAWIEWLLADRERMRFELERIVAAVAPGPERAAVLQSPEFDAALDAASASALSELSQAWATRIVPLCDSERRIRTLKVKQGQLKRDLVDTAAEQRKLKERLRELEGRHAKLERLLIDFIGFDPATRREASGPIAGSELDRALAARIREIWMELRGNTSQSALDRAACSSEILRFRLANSVSVSGGGRDQTLRIDALAAALDAIPVSQDRSAAEDESACRR
jgi:hypothetical protein